MYWLFLGVTALVVGLAVFVLVDLARAKRPAFQGSMLARSLWAFPQVAVLLFAVLASLPQVVNASIGGVLALLLLPVLAVQVAYLLRVVYPSPARLAAQVSEAPATVATDTSSLTTEE